MASRRLARVLLLLPGVVGAQEPVPAPSAGSQTPIFEVGVDLIAVDVSVVDAQGRPTYRLAVVNGQLINKSFQTNTALGDVYQLMVSFRYLFN